MFTEYRGDIFSGVLNGLENMDSESTWISMDCQEVRTDGIIVAVKAQSVG
jgi:hypothetical protein